MSTSPSTTGVRTQRNPPQLAGMTLRHLDADVAEPVITARAQLRSSPGPRIRATPLADPGPCLLQGDQAATSRQPVMTALQTSTWLYQTCIHSDSSLAIQSALRVSQQGGIRAI